MALVHGRVLTMQLAMIILAAAMTTTTTMVVAADREIHPPPQAKPGCQDRCGNITVPYPYGIEENCFMKGQADEYNLTCDHSKDPPSLIWPGVNDTRITKFSLDEGEMQITNLISLDCYDKEGNETNSVKEVRVTPPRTISGTKNVFVAVGCDTFAAFRGFQGEKEFITGCTSLCNNKSTIDQNSCSGVGCCSSNIPDGLKNISVDMDSFSEHEGILDFNPCSYAFVAANGLFNFSRKSFAELKGTYDFPMVVNWHIGNETCDVAQKRKGEDYACMENTTCHNQSITAGPGYFCRCKEGYEGNPYLGCQEKNECSSGNPCGYNGTCHNTLGSYYCKCRKGFMNDGEDRKKCIPRNKENYTPLIISLGVCISLLVLSVGTLLIYRVKKRRQFTKLKEKYFKANGGPKLQQWSRECLGTSARVIFTADELTKATDDYNESRIVGEGGYGLVYKGLLAIDHYKVVAVKTSKLSVQVDSDEFINEVMVLSQISHKNVLKLLGCCLETKMPILVYEYVENGTLYEHIHNGKGSLSLELRLKIAAEIARALAYLHHSISPRIIHRDVKSTNILLDENFTAKVSDFGASRLVPLDDDTILSTLIKGTMGYLDPEYLQSNRLTEKSDVYSFGVVLVELFTSQKAVSFERPEPEKNLASYFLSKLENGTPLDQVLDQKLVKDEYWEIITDVAKLAERCLSLKGVQRPSMKEVERDLDEILKILEKQSAGKELRRSTSKEPDRSNDESKANICIVEVRSESSANSSGIITGVEYDASMKNQSQQPLNHGR